MIVFVPINLLYCIGIKIQKQTIVKTIQHIHVLGIPTFLKFRFV